jgi:hypothetical protein
VITEVKAPNMGGEDFAYYLEKLPGAFMFLSSSNPAKGTDVSHHNPKFDVDEDVLWEGSAVFVAIVEEFFLCGNPDHNLFRNMGKNIKNTFHRYFNAHSYSTDPRRITILCNGCRSPA